MSTQKSTIALQDVFLAQIRKEKVPVTVYLFNGVPLKGIIKKFDKYVILFETENKKEIQIFKTAISTIIPAEPVIKKGHQNSN
ncbi:RNA chaperone Hfq [Caldanaerobacter subterraneus]|uniref:RNA-binding protein Hfq n=1 Tax=Caldanaerobacter subterraneus TaxID=911092 RepID=A0A7Y2L5Y0_9THEO|nr:RNA chaperone Hfq [Caldanaerobacter subterraneus]